MTDTQAQGVAQGISTSPQELLEKTQKLIEQLEKLRSYVVAKEGVAAVVQQRLQQSTPDVVTA